MKVKNLFYFGTSTTEGGHYYYKFYRDGRMFSLYEKPDGLDKVNTYESEDNPIKGEFVFTKQGDFYTYHADGSCFDDRGGCTTCFIYHGEITETEMLELILSNHSAKMILASVAFNRMRETLEMEGAPCFVRPNAA